MLCAHFNKRTDKTDKIVAYKSAVVAVRLFRSVFLA